ncbi:MAG: SET domain-containing protein-lysine N-methyltransferase [Simkaniaceae bacterium]|nr:SET domain-containing protein-lysine N-methyltransferase [Simkaniaceae bacterium]
MMIEFLGKGETQSSVITLQQLEKLIGFRYVEFLEFISKDIHDRVVSHATPTENHLSFGDTYREAICLGALAPVSVRWINDEVGFGLFAATEIHKGAFIGEYTGVVRENNDHLKMSNYLFGYPVNDDIDRPLVIDAENGNLTRFINHSYSPNLEKGYAYCNGMFHMVLYAGRTIQPGEQLFYDYGQTYWRIRSKPEAFTHGNNNSNRI